MIDAITTQEAVQEARTLRTDIQVRFYDTDAFGHLSNIAFSNYAEIARLHIFAPFRDEVVGLILVNLCLDFRSQVRYGDEVYVLTRVGKIGNSSVTLLQDIYANDKLACETSSVVVCFDYEAQKPMRVPDSFRQAYPLPAPT